MASIEASYHQLVEKSQDWLQRAVVTLPNILVAILLFLFFLYLSKQFSMVLFKVLGRFSHNVNVNKILRVVSQFVIISIGIFVALSILKLDKALSSLLAGAGIIGIALSFAFQDIAANFMSGVIIAVRRPFSVGELVETKGYLGRIEGISLRTTKLVSLGGQLVIIPNKEILQNPLVNYSYTGMRRVELFMRVSYDEDLEKVRDLVISTFHDIPFLNADKEIEFYYKEFGDYSIRVLIRFWINAYFQKDYYAATSQAIINIKKALDANGIKIPVIAKGVWLSGEKEPGDNIVI